MHAILESALPSGENNDVGAVRGEHGDPPNKDAPFLDSMVPASAQVGPTATATTATSATRLVARPRSERGTLARELAMIAGARARLAAGDLSGAGGALREHEYAFAKGQLREERDALRVQLLQAQGLKGASEERAAKLMRDFPNSPMKAAIAGKAVK